MSTEAATARNRSLERMVRAFRWLRGRWRLWCGLCPACNSDAPEMDSCEVCDGYHILSDGYEFPPPDMKLFLWRRRWERLAAKRSNDPKLSDREARRDGCEGEAKKEAPDV